ncbi:hypothetical protein [Brachybacterium subflavum]|uniref:hypothetical protein n=1 Tax=Brachybacterium subflavum TaxID=2585206 RepID=UPI001266140D|nr:hypothetical protein [Brachybacterium subflavum]
MAARDAALKLGANVIVRLGVLALVVFTWRPWDSWSSPVTWVLGVLMLFLLIWNLRMLVVDGRALLGLARGRGGAGPSDAAECRDR